MLSKFFLPVSSRWLSSSGFGSSAKEWKEAERIAKSITSAYYRACLRTIRSLGPIRRKYLTYGDRSKIKRSYGRLYRGNNVDDEEESLRSREAYYSSYIKENILAEWDIFLSDPANMNRRGGLLYDCDEDEDELNALCQEYRSLIEKGERSRKWILKKYHVAEDPHRGWLERWHVGILSKGNVRLDIVDQLLPPCMNASEDKT